MITLVKFIRNQQKKSSNRFVTRTLGKVGVIHSGYYWSMTDRPRHDEFWYVEILEETGKGSSTGCFVLRPLQKVGSCQRQGRVVPDVVRLIPGTFDTEKIGNTIYVYPRNVDGLNGPNWILDGDTKSHLTQTHKQADSGNATYHIGSMIVVFDEPYMGSIVKTAEDEPILDLEDVGEYDDLDIEGG